MKHTTMRNILLRQCFSNCVPPEISRCAAKLLRLLQFARVFEKLEENFKNFPYQVCRVKISHFLGAASQKSLRNTVLRTSSGNFKDS
jgi:hypothetical protein